MNSKFGNVFARHIAGLRGVYDCTSGYRAIKTSLLKKIDMKNLGAKGYSFQMNLLFEASRKEANIKEIAIQFKDRTEGTSKLRKQDILEFIRNTFFLGYQKYERYAILTTVAVGSFIVIIATLILHTDKILKYHILFDYLIVILSTLMAIQGVISLFWMLYGWEDPEKIEKNKTPKYLIKPYYSFTALLPVKEEEHVIGDTLRSISNITYPRELKEVIIICHEDDTATIRKINETLSYLKDETIKLVTFSSNKTSKPHSLNIGLANATNEVVVVFDAEDRPHRQIYQIVNTVMKNEQADIVQSGVQLMNFTSKWYATMNVLEYYFWFKSTLHYFSSVGIIPLAGNTVFFKKNWLRRVDGWDESCLTEDADIGIRLSLAGAKTKVVYDEKHVTREEVPTNVSSFIKQRTRWNQGFIQILAKKDWLLLPKLSQKILAFYILIVPELQAMSFLLIPLNVIAAFDLRLPVLEALFTLLPLTILVLELITYNVGMYEFIKNYNMKYKIITPFRVILFFYPFQLLLGFSALRAVVRTIKANNEWEKTKHVNAHAVFTTHSNYDPSIN